MRIIKFLYILILLLLTSVNNYFIEFIILLGVSLPILLFLKERQVLLIFFNCFLSWVGTTKGLEGDYLFYSLEYTEANISSFSEYISEHIKSPFFYFLFYLNSFIGLSFRQATGLIIFIFNLLFFDASKNIFSTKKDQFYCSLLFLIYFPIFDSSTHLFRQHVASIVMIWSISKVNIQSAITALFTHLTSIVFIPQYLLLLDFQRIKKLMIVFGVCILLFFNIIVEFVTSFVIDRFINTTDLEELNYLIYFIISICIIALVNKIYRKLLLLPTITILLTMYALKENSEIVFRISKYFNYLIPIAIIYLSKSLSSIFLQRQILYKALQLNTILVLSSYFIYKVFLFPNWTYFY